MLCLILRNNVKVVPNMKDMMRLILKELVCLTMLHSELTKLYGVLAIVSAIGLSCI